MFSIEKDLDNINSYSFVYNHNKHLCLLLHLNKDIKNKDIDDYLNIVKVLSEITDIVLIIAPEISYDIVSKFQINNVHILRLNLSTNLEKNNHSFYLKNSEGKIVFVINNKEYGKDNRKINLDLYIPNYKKEFDLSKYNFSYDIFYDQAIIKVENEKDKKELLSFLNNVLKIKKVIFVSSKNRYFARFIDNNNLLVYLEKNNKEYDNNLNVLSKYNSIFVDEKTDLLNKFVIVKNNIVIDKTSYIKNKDVLDETCLNLGYNIIQIDISNKKISDKLSEILIPIPQSNQHKYYEEEKEVIKKFKAR